MPTRVALRSGGGLSGTAVTSGLAGGENVTRTYTAVLVRDEDGRYCVSVPALKGRHTWGADIGEALMMARDAIEGYLCVLREDGDPPPEEGPQLLLDIGDAREALVYRLTVEEDALVV